MQMSLELKESPTYINEVTCPNYNQLIHIGMDCISTFSKILFLSNNNFIIPSFNPGFFSIVFF